MRAVIWTRGEHCKNLGLAVCQYFGSQNSRHASQFALLWLVVCGRTRAKRGNGARRSDLAHGKLTDTLVTEEQHPSLGPAQRFSVVLRARGRSAGGTASCPGLGDLGLMWMECGSSLHSPLSGSTYAVRHPIFLELATGRQMAEITFNLPATSNQLKA